MSSKEKEEKSQTNVHDTTETFSKMVLQLQKLKDVKSTVESRNQEMVELIFAIHDDLNPSKCSYIICESQLIFLLLF